MKSDGRYSGYLYGCYECGLCVAACPSARFYDFSPRVLAQTVAREDVDRFSIDRSNFNKQVTSFIICFKDLMICNII
ncbi:MAG: hypothetical protein HeimC2_33530 [Candidatus Heimdallarchaeota archaeon LC_2]|nr:MAG: hypothetical protein HeimC2_33530 [Candidatus Heimdallarchaeota archaeon LC_2]